MKATSRLQPNLDGKRLQPIYQPLILTFLTGHPSIEQACHPSRDASSPAASWIYSKCGSDWWSAWRRRQNSNLDGRTATATWTMEISWHLKKQFSPWRFAETSVICTITWWDELAHRFWAGFSNHVSLPHFVGLFHTCMYGWKYALIEAPVVVEKKCPLTLTDRCCSTELNPMLKEAHER